MRLQWRYNPFDFDPFREVVFPRKANELAVVQAEHYYHGQEPLKGGSSDPCGSLALLGQEIQKTAIKKKTEPVFHNSSVERVARESGDQPSLTLNVQDWDAVSSNDPMGK